MPRQSMKDLQERVAILEHDNHLLAAGLQAAANDEIKWFARTQFDNTRFRFGVFGLTRADGGNIVVQTRVKQNDGKYDRPYSTIIPIDEIQERIKSGVTFGTEYYHLAIRLRNEAVANEQIAKAS